MAQPKYNPVGQSLDLGVALIQAASALDMSAKFAIECRDHESLITIAAAWLELGKRLEYDGEEDDETPDRRNPIGFSYAVDSDIEKVPSATDEIDEEESEDDCD